MHRVGVDSIFLEVQTKVDTDAGKAERNAGMTASG